MVASLRVMIMMDEDAVDDDNDDEYGDKEAITQHICLQIVLINNSWSNNDVTPHLYLCRDVCPFNASDDRPHNRPGDYNSSETSPSKGPEISSPANGRQTQWFPGDQKHSPRNSFQMSSVSTQQKIIDTFPQFIGWLMGFVAKSLRLVLKPGIITLCRY